MYRDCCKYRPIVGSSFLEAPDFVKAKHAIVNVENRHDSLCFVWSVLAHLHPAVRNPNLFTHYMKYLSELNISCLKFPLAVNDVPKFELLNPFLRVNVLTYENSEKDFIPLYASPHRNRQTTVNLSLLADGEKRHYVLINSLSRLVRGRTAHRG
jgi:hypothetical protein